VKCTYFPDGPMQLLCAFKHSVMRNILQLSLIE